jgi:hypothetical protein
MIRAILVQLHKKMISNKMLVENGLVMGYELGHGSGCGCVHRTDAMAARLRREFYTHAPTNQLITHN